MTILLIGTNEKHAKCMTWRGMLGIDYTVLSVHLPSSETENLCSVAIEFRDLQAAYISINRKKNSPASPASLSPSLSDSRSFLGGTFAIVERNQQFLEDVVNSTVSISATVLANGDRSALFSYACGANESVSQDRGIIESYMNGNHEGLSGSEDDPNFLQKLSVFGEASIMAYFQSVAIDLIHSIGVSSIAGSVTISIAIIDLSKVRKAKITESTESARKDLPRNVAEKPAEIAFDMDGFLNQLPHQRDIAKKSAESTRIKSNQEEGSSTEGPDEHSDSDCDSDSGSSVSIHSFLARISGRKALIVEPTELAAIELSDSKDVIENDRTGSIPKDTSSFRYPVIEKEKPNVRTIPQGMRRTPAIVGYALGRPPPSAQTQSGVRVQGYATVKKVVPGGATMKKVVPGGATVKKVVRGGATMKKVAKEWDSAPMTRQDYSKKGPLQSSGNQKISSKAKNSQKEAIMASIASKANSTDTSISTSPTTSPSTTTSSRCDSIDRKLLFSSYQNIQVSTFKILRGAEIDIDKRESKIPSQKMSINTGTVSEEIGGHRKEDLAHISDADAEISIMALPEVIESEAAPHPYDMSCLSNTS